MSGRTTTRERDPARDSDACRTSGPQAPPMQPNSPETPAPHADVLARTLGRTTFDVAKNANREQIAIPDSVAERMGLAPGERVRLVETTDGFALVADAEFNKRMESAREIMREDRAFLEELARK